MLQMINKKLRNRKGFTLIELIVVIAILGILAVIAIPRFVGMRESANEGAVIANLRTIQNAAEIAAAENNIAITAVTDDQISEVLTGAAGNFPGDFADSPDGAVYSFASGVATLATAPSVYPTGGVNDYTDIASN
ncbi:MAG: putative type pilin [Anaerosolibacter sp.]|uniref:type II secretion system protein n=1 Tax=Anaerosolibacter sp. TaxID=1872527 RepID=UPI00260A5818|nr:type II secretion system protein [Anaerosolibacter sp.]MDF2546497.1 putative type pilin [Anaerosolibacter sp.]